MAVSTETDKKSDLGIVVEGEQTDLQIIEEGSDSEGGQSAHTSNLAITSDETHTDLALPSRSPVFGSVAVTNSENVHFGDKYIKIYNGPVNIKQLVQPGSGVDNESFTKTEDENVANTNKHNHVGSKGDQKFQIRFWHKLTFSVIGVFLIGGICALIVTIQPKNDEFTIDPTLNFDDIHKNKNTVVVGLCYAKFHMYIICIIMTPLTIFFVYCLLLIIRKFLNTECVVSNKIVSNNINYFNDHSADELFVSPHHLRIVGKSDWLAQPEVDKLDKIRQPVPWVIITHTATETCYTQSACVLRVRLIQSFHIESRGWFDIGYNFLVGGDGSAYFGRGWDYQGAHTKGYNKYSMGIALIGTFNKDNPTNQQIEACRKLIQLGVEEGKLAKDYKLFVHRQLMSTLSPGDKVYDIVKTWPHFVHNYTKDLVPNY